MSCTVNSPSNLSLESLMMIKLRISNSMIAIFVATVFSATTHGQILEEIVVTAQKREQSLQDVGISVTAFSGEQINHRN